MHERITRKSHFGIAQRAYSPFLGVVAAFTVEFWIGFARGYAAANISPIVVSVYYAVNVTLLRYVRHHEGLRARITERYLANVLPYDARKKNGITYETTRENK